MCPHTSLLHPAVEAHLTTCLAQCENAGPEQFTSAGRWGAVACALPQCGAEVVFTKRYSGFDGVVLGVEVERKIGLRDGVLLPRASEGVWRALCGV